MYPDLYFFRPYGPEGHLLRRFFREPAIRSRFVPVKKGFPAPGILSDQPGPGHDDHDKETAEAGAWQVRADTGDDLRENEREARVLFPPSYGEKTTSRSPAHPDLPPHSRETIPDTWRIPPPGS